MAKCFKCNKEIDWFSFFIGTFKHIKKNFYHNPISTCPHCKVEYSQTKTSSIAFNIITFALFAIAYLVLKYFNSLKANINIWAILGLLVFGILTNCLWWRFFAEVREPYMHFWE